MGADWDPQQYRRFATEREQPFHDLLGLIERAAIADAVDLGCGSGELTATAAATLGVQRMVGIDDSPAMLDAAVAHVRPGVRFASGDIAGWTSAHDIDLVLANASLQWVPDHPSVLRRWASALRPGGQLAVQVPANAHSPTHRVIDEVAHREPFLSAFGAAGPPADPVALNVLEPEHYSQLLHDLGFVRQHVRLQVYAHVLPSTRHAVEWVKGTTLRRIAEGLDRELYETFVAEYERALIATVGDRQPFFFPFRRILLWGRLG